MFVTMKAVEIPAGEFKAKCLALLDEVSEAGRTFVVTKRGRPVASISPPPKVEGRGLTGSVLWEHDLELPTGEQWDGKGDSAGHARLGLVGERFRFLVGCGEEAFG